MTQNRDNPGGAAAQGRATRRGLGPPEPPRDERTASGAFARPWPELDESAEYYDASADAELDASAEDPPTRVFDGRPQSRGPEYHPPSLPGGARERGAGGTSSTGTFRVGSQASSVQVRAPSDTDPQLRPPPERAGWQGLVSPRLLGSVLVGLSIGSALALAIVRVPVRAHGVLKASGVPEALGATVAGSVGAVQVSAGAEVEAGDAVLQIHSPELERTLASRRMELELLEQELDAATQSEKAALARNLMSLERRRQVLSQRLELKDTELSQRRALVDDVTALVGAGSMPATEIASANLAVQAASEARLGIVDAMSELDIEVTDRRSEQQERERLRRARLTEAEARLRDAEGALGVTTIRAPAAGWVESLLVTPGSTVQVGTELARLVPRSAPRSVVALVPLEDAADVAVGEDASVELSPRNQNEGALVARVRHISREVAPAARVEAILGAPSPDGFVQLELELLDAGEYQGIEPQLRAGSRALVSFVTPTRRLGSVLYDALAEWLSFGVWR